MDDVTKKLPAGALELTQVTAETSKIAKARDALYAATGRRAAAMRDAREAGADTEQIAAAASVSVQRVRQILGGAK